MPTSCLRAKPSISHSRSVAMPKPMQHGFVYISRTGLIVIRKWVQPVIKHTKRQTKNKKTKQKERRNKLRVQPKQRRRRWRKSNAERHQEAAHSSTTPKKIVEYRKKARGGKERKKEEVHKQQHSLIYIYTYIHTSREQRRENQIEGKGKDEKYIYSPPRKGKPSPEIKRITGPNLEKVVFFSHG